MYLWFLDGLVAHLFRVSNYFEWSNCDTLLDYLPFQQFDSIRNQILPGSFPPDRYDTLSSPPFLLQIRLRRFQQRR